MQRLYRTGAIALIVAGLAVTVAALPGCGSTLAVTPYSGNGISDGASVPIFLPSYDFIAEELGMDASGKRVAPDRAGLRVTQVARPDPSRGFLVKNSVGWFSASEFTINRDVRGVMTKVSAQGDDKTLETTLAVVSVIAGAIGISPLYEVKTPDQVLDEERVTLETRVMLLLDTLKTSSDPAGIKVIQDALNLLRTRLEAINKKLRGALGTKPSGQLPVSIHAQPADWSSEAGRQAFLDQQEVGIHVLLIPVR